jgi:hypothetical protein
MVLDPQRSILEWLPESLARVRQRATFHEHRHEGSCVPTIISPQVIAEPDERYEEYCRSSDFIREHIFPGARGQRRSWLTVGQRQLKAC